MYDFELVGMIVVIGYFLSILFWRDEKVAMFICSGSSFIGMVIALIKMAWMAI